MDATDQSIRRMGFLSKWWADVTNNLSPNIFGNPHHTSPNSKQQEITGARRSFGGGNFCPLSFVDMVNAVKCFRCQEGHVMGPFGRHNLFIGTRFQTLTTGPHRKKSGTVVLFACHPRLNRAPLPYSPELQRPAELRHLSAVLAACRLVFGCSPASRLCHSFRPSCPWPPAQSGSAPRDRRNQNRHLLKSFLPQTTAEHRHYTQTRMQHRDPKK